MSTDAVVQNEREILTQVLHHLREVEVRRLFSDLGYKSLFEFAMKRLGYSEDQAARRIAAMRLMREMPELESKIESGALNLTNLGLAQTHFRKEKPSLEEKVQLLSELENKSTREAVRVVQRASQNPVALKPDLVRELGEGQFGFEFVGDAELKELLEQARGLLAHAHGDLSMNELLKVLAREFIERKSPAHRRTRAQSPAAPRVTVRRRPASGAQASVWRRAKGKCENCGSVHRLEVDHIKPQALGGTDEIDNLRLLCRSCNQRAAVRALGLEKIRVHFT